ncbi:MAG: hypothetical protein QF775_00285, partial [archaeon]|jgi:hypothetical protein|nr:hypothetical protein [archaeon]
LHIGTISATIVSENGDIHHLCYEKATIGPNETALLSLSFERNYFYEPSGDQPLSFSFSISGKGEVVSVAISEQSVSISHIADENTTVAADTSGFVFTTAVFEGISNPGTITVTATGNHATSSNLTGVSIWTDMDDEEGYETQITAAFAFTGNNTTLTLPLFQDTDIQGTTHMAIKAHVPETAQNGDVYSLSITDIGVDAEVQSQITGQGPEVIVLNR